MYALVSSTRYSRNCMLTPTNFLLEKGDALKMSLPTCFQSKMGWNDEGKEKLASLKLWTVCSSVWIIEIENSLDMCIVRVKKV